MVTGDFYQNIFGAVLGYKPDIGKLRGNWETILEDSGGGSYSYSALKPGCPS